MKKKLRYDPAKPYLVSGIIVILIALAVLTYAVSGNERITDASASPGDALGTAEVRTAGRQADPQDGSHGAGDAADTVAASALSGGVSQETASASADEHGLTHEEKWQEGYIRYKGEKYKYNPGLRSYLFLGIDSDDMVCASEDLTKGGQSDALFLITVDDHSKEIRVININRNSMTDIEICDPKGRSVGTYTAQICLQHGYGDGMSLSCERSVRAVSNLFFNIPINGYYSLNMGGLSILNDMLGGVEVRVPSDFESPSYGISLKAGETVLMDGLMAYRYIRQRDVTMFDSATERAKRHQAYLAGLFKSLAEYVEGDNDRALDLYDRIAPYSVTDIDLTSLASDVSRYRFDAEDIRSLQGCTKQGDVFEEFFVDDDYLYDLIIEMFYVRV